MTVYDMQKFLQDLEYLVNIDSKAENFAGVDKVAEGLQAPLVAQGWHTLRPDVGPKAAAPLVLTNTDGNEYDVLLCCHMDTVFPDGTAAERPYSVKDGRAYGPGVSDMKSCCLQAIYVLEALTKAKALPQLKVCALFNSEEERSSNYTHATIEEMARRSRYCIVLEAARANGARVIERKGIIHPVIRMKGVASHAGNAPQAGRSAINEMAYWTLKLAGLTDFSTGLTVNVGVVKAGSACNVVAPDAFMDVDIRIVAKEQKDIIDKAFEELKEHARTAEIGVEVEYASLLPPMASLPGTEELAAIIDDASRAYGMSTEWVKAGGASDGNYTAGVGTVTVDGVGPIGGGGHSPEEYLDLASIEPSLHVLEKVLLDLQAKLYK